MPDANMRNRPTMRFLNVRIGVPAGACSLVLAMASLAGCANSHSPLASNGTGIPAGYNEPHRSGWNPSSERPAWLRDLPPEIERERSADDGYGAHLG